MITPCTNHARYALWLQKHFKHVVGREEYHFVDQVLSIHNRERKKKYAKFNPMEWKLELGEHLYRRYVNFIIQLMIIFKATNSEKIIPYSKYMLVKDAYFKNINDEYIKAIAMPIIRPVPLSQPVYPNRGQRSLYANNYQPPPFAEDIPDIAMPPPYEVPYGRELPLDEMDITPPVPPLTISTPQYSKESPAVSKHRREKRRQ